MLALKPLLVCVSFFLCNAMYDCEKNLVILTCTSFLNDTLIYLITSKTCNIALHLGV